MLVSRLFILLVVLIWLYESALLIVGTAFALGKGTWLLHTFLFLCQYCWLGFLFPVYILLSWSPSCWLSLPGCYCGQFSLTISLLAEATWQGDSCTSHPIFPWTIAASQALVDDQHFCALHCCFVLYHVGLSKSLFVLLFNISSAKLAAYSRRESYENCLWPSFTAGLSMPITGRLFRLWLQQLKMLGLS